MSFSAPWSPPNFFLSIPQTNVSSTQSFGGSVYALGGSKAITLSLGVDDGGAGFAVNQVVVDATQFSAGDWNINSGCPELTDNGAYLPMQFCAYAPGGAGSPVYSGFVDFLYHHPLTPPTGIDSVFSVQTTDMTTPSSRFLIEGASFKDPTTGAISTYIVNGTLSIAPQKNVKDVPYVATVKVTWYTVEGQKTVHNAVRRLYVYNFA